MRPRRSVVERVSGGDPPAPRPSLRLRIFVVVLVVCFGSMTLRLWYIQVLNNAAYAQTVSLNQLRPSEIPPPRGLIVGRDGTVLVGNQVTYKITLSRLAAQQHPAVVPALAALLGVPPAQVQSDLDSQQYLPYQPIPVQSQATNAQVVTIREHPSEFPGVTAEATTERSYPGTTPADGTPGAQMYGYVRPITASQLQAHKSDGYLPADDFGQFGLEMQYQPYLRGKPGENKIEVDAQGRVVGSLGINQPAPGDDVITNIDPGLQDTLQSALDAQINALKGTPSGSSSGAIVGATSGAAVALDPQTGAVLAMVSSPSYDLSFWENPNITQAQYQALQGDPSGDPMLNRVTEGVYPPGSEFKVATATAALKYGLITPSYQYDDTGTYVLPACSAGPKCVFHDNAGESNGPIDVTRALTVSSDVFFYNLGVMFWEQRAKFGQTPIQDVANAYGYGEQNPIDLPSGEVTPGQVDSPAVKTQGGLGPWLSSDNLELAFGQGATIISPLEQALAYATFANGGTRYAPQIAAGVVAPDGTVVKSFPPKVVDQVPLSPQEHQAMLNGFEGVIDQPGGTADGIFQSSSYGQGGIFQDPPFPLATFPLAGKTSTASTKAGNGIPDGWFVGFGPVPNPRYVIAVVIAHSGYGSTAAAPVVRRGFEYLLNHPESPPVLKPPVGTAGSCVAPPAAGPGAPPGAGSTTSCAAPTTTTPTTTTTRPSAKKRPSTARKALGVVPRHPSHPVLRALRLPASDRARGAASPR